MHKGEMTGSEKAPAKVRGRYINWSQRQEAAVPAWDAPFEAQEKLKHAPTFFKMDQFSLEPRQLSALDAAIGGPGARFARPGQSESSG
jgi:hypothetical protein